MIMIRPIENYTNNSYSNNNNDFMIYKDKMGQITERLDLRQGFIRITMIKTVTKQVRIKEYLHTARYVFDQELTTITVTILLMMVIIIVEIKIMVMIILITEIPSLQDDDCDSNKT